MPDPLKWLTEEALVRQQVEWLRDAENMDVQGLRIVLDKGSDGSLSVLSLDGDQTTMFNAMIDTEDNIALIEIHE